MSFKLDINGDNDAEPSKAQELSLDIDDDMDFGPAEDTNQAIASTKESKTKQPESFSQMKAKDYTVCNQKNLGTQQKVIGRVLQDPANQFCFDCGWKDPEYVSINNSVLICQNCAQIHQAVYPVEISYPKSFFTEPTCKFNKLQLHVLINGGNARALEFYKLYGLDQMSIQKRYSTNAAQHYRNLLLKSSDEDFNCDSPILIKKPQKSLKEMAMKEVNMRRGLHSNFIKLNQPTYEEGIRKAAPGPDQTLTSQQVAYSKQIDYRQILQELLQNLDQDKTTLESSLPMYDRFNGKMLELEMINKSAYEAQSHQIAQAKENNQSLTSIVVESNPCLPPFTCPLREPLGPYQPSTKVFLQQCGDKLHKSIIDYAESNSVKFDDILLMKLLSTDDILQRMNSEEQKDQNQNQAKVGKYEAAKSEARQKYNQGKQYVSQKLEEREAKKSNPFEQKKPQQIQPPATPSSGWRSLWGLVGDDKQKTKKPSQPSTTKSTLTGPKFIWTEN